MPLRLTYKNVSSVPVEVEGITPDAVAGKTLDQISKLVVYRGNREVELAELFQVGGDPADECIDFEGDLAGVHWIGAKMRRGQIRVRGNAGRHLGSELQGGVILVEGDVSDWVGGEMHGGLIHVHGRAGHLAGAAYRGSAKGMTGGSLLIRGRAGNEVGHSMRRGLIAIGESVGDLAGFNMLAGSIFALGNGGIRHGAGMRRGTIGFFGKEPLDLLPSFRYACRYRPLALKLVSSFLDRHEFPFDAARFEAEVDLYHGDFIEGGRGEVWVGRER